MSRRLPILAAALVAAAIPAAARAQPPVGTRWSLSGSAAADFQAAVDTTVAHAGRASLRIAAADDPAGFGTLSTTFAPGQLAGRRVRVSAWLRTAALEGQGAALWARADTAMGMGGGGAFATTQGRRYLAGTLAWTPVFVELDVPANTRSIVLGALAMGRGTLWLDDVRVEADGNGRALGFEAPDTLVVPPPSAAGALAASPREAPRAASARGLDNLVAFARLTGYVRFFHPSDAGLTTNWDEFTLRGMRAVERAPDADSLAATLRALFAPVAPAVAVYRTGTTPPAPAAPPTGEAVGIVFWQHFGYGVPAGTPGMAPGRMSVYRSLRRRVPAPNGRAPAVVAVASYDRGRSSPVPDPAAPFVAELGGGVTASVPLALYTAAATVDTAWRPAPASERYALADRATRLADVALLWMVPQHFYPYFDVVRVDWDAELRRALATAATDSGGTAFDATLQRLVAALRDGHGNVVRGGGSSAGALPDVRFGWVEGRVVVTAVGDTAAAAGVKRGDEVTAVDGRPVADVLRDFEARISGATPQWIRSRALAQLAAGLPEHPATLRLRDPLAPRERPRDVRVARGVAPVPAEQRPEKVAELRPGVFYVDFDRVTDADIQAALPKLTGATGIVFDMRGYPRQVNTPNVLSLLADSPIRSARFEVPTITRPDHAGMLFGSDGAWVLQPQQPRLKARVAFLSGGGAISYAESTLGVVEENRLGDIVGEPSAGTNGNVNPFGLPGGYTVVWTGMRVQKRDGTPHHGVGVKPTVPVSPTLRGIREGRDEVLERALAVVAAPKM